MSWAWKGVGGVVEWGEAVGLVEVGRCGVVCFGLVWCTLVVVVGSTNRPSMVLDGDGRWWSADDRVVDSVSTVARQCYRDVALVSRGGKARQLAWVGLGELEMYLVDWAPILHLTLLWLSALMLWKWQGRHRGRCPAEFWCAIIAPRITPPSPSSSLTRAYYRAANKALPVAHDVPGGGGMPGRGALLEG